MENVSDGSDVESEELVVENATTGDIPCGQDERIGNPVLGDVTLLPVTVDDSGKVASSAAACSLRSESSSSFYDDRIPRIPKVEGGRTIHQHTPSPMFPGYVNTERQSEKAAMESLHHLYEPFSMFMYSILQVFRNPEMESFVNELDNKYGNRSGPVSHEYDQDPELRILQNK